MPLFKNLVHLLLLKIVAMSKNAICKLSLWSLLTSFLASAHIRKLFYCSGWLPRPPFLLLDEAQTCKEYACDPMTSSWAWKTKIWEKISHFGFHLEPLGLVSLACIPNTPTIWHFIDKKGICLQHYNSHLRDVGLTHFPIKNACRFYSSFCIL